MKCSDIIMKLEELAPCRCASEWDNIGLLAGRRERSVERVFLALDATDEVIEAAISFNADMLITHHPLIFKPLLKVNDDDFIGKRILTLIQHDISYYAMHTNFDAAPGCMADLASEKLGLLHGQIMEVTDETEGIVSGVGRAGELPNPMTLKELADTVKVAFGLPFVTVYGDLKSDHLLTRAAICPGSGKSVIKYGLKAGSEVFITGDIGHHEGIDCLAQGMAVIDAGHYGLEHIFMDFMEDYMMQTFGTQVKLCKAEPAFPAAVC